MAICMFLYTTKQVCKNNDSYPVGDKEGKLRMFRFCWRENFHQKTFQLLKENQIRITAQYVKGYER